MKKYIIFTKVQGFVFYMCYNETRGAFVSTDAPDSDVMKFDEEEKAEAVAKRNSNETTTYEVKEVVL
jgi:hypothetical protein